MENAVRLTDTGTVAATVLSGIGGTTGGTVTVAGAMTITGSTEQITNALVTEANKVIATGTNVTFVGDNPTGAQLADINDAAGGTRTC